jgi:hypothetical protein
LPNFYFFKYLLLCRRLLLVLCLLLLICMYKLLKPLLSPSFVESLIKNALTYSIDSCANLSLIWWLNWLKGFNLLIYIYFYFSQSMFLILWLWNNYIASSSMFVTNTTTLYFLLLCNLLFHRLWYFIDS